MQEDFDVPFGNSPYSNLYAYLNDSDNITSKNNLFTNLSIPKYEEFNKNLEHGFLKETFDKKDIQTSINIPKEIHHSKNLQTNANVSLKTFDRKDVQSHPSELQTNNSPPIDKNYQKYLEYIQIQNNKSKCPTISEEGCGKLSTVFDNKNEISKSTTILDSLQNTFLNNHIYTLCGHDIKCKHLLYTIGFIILCFVIYKIWKWMTNNEKNNEKNNDDGDKDDIKKKKKDKKKDKKSQDDSLYIPIYNDKN